MKVLVTGGSGFIGTNLINELMTRDVSILNLDINSPYDKNHFAYWKPVDLLDRKDLLEAFGEFKPDWVIHLAARADCDECTTVVEGYSANTVGHQNLLDAVRETPSIKRLIVTSSQYVSGPQHTPTADTDYAPVTVYGQSKVITEQLTRSAELECCWTIIRPTNIWGPWHKRYQSEFWNIASRGLYFHPGGKPVVRCYGYVGNLVSYIETILHAPCDKVNGKTFYISDPPDDIYNWANSFCMALRGKPAKKIPRFILRILGIMGDVMSFTTGKPFYITSSRVKSMTSNYLLPDWALHDLDDLGNRKFTLEQGVQLTAKWFIDQRNV